MPRREEQGITIRFPVDLVKEVRKFASQEQRSINSEVVYAVQMYVEARRKRADSIEEVETEELVS